MDLKNSRILLTGGAGFLGSAIKRRLIQDGVPEGHITVPRSAHTDLRDKAFCDLIVPGHDVVIHAAGNVGGIGKNRDHPDSLCEDNLLMGIHLLHAARRSGVKKFVTIGTVCEYPKFAFVPFKESELWGGYPEETNAPYGLAKKMLLVLGQAHRQVSKLNVIHPIVVNLYGPGDNFDPKSSHAIPALIVKIAEAKKANQPTIEVWGTGMATREFLYVDDAAEAIVKATELYDKSEPINIGSGLEIPIKNLTYLIANLMEYKGEIIWDSTKPDGQPRRCLDVSKAKEEFNFQSTTDFKTGLKATIDWYPKKGTSD